MNRTYKSIYNERTGTFVAVAENVKAKGKPASSRVSKAGGLVAAVAAGALVMGSALAEVEVNQPDNTINFTAPAGVIGFAGDNGSITGVSSITGLTGLTVNGALSATSITVGGESVATSTQLDTAMDGMTALDVRVTDNEDDITALDVRVTDNEDDITTLDGRVTINEGDITALDSRVTINEGDITTLESRLANLGVDDDTSGVKYFRANSEADDSVASGQESIAIGPNTVSAGESSFAAGDGAATTATAEGAIALGQGATAGTEGGVVSDGEGSIAIGRDSHAAGNSTVALGDGANIDSEYIADATALGAGASVSGNFSTGGTALGANALASAGNATALGTDAVASGDGSIAIGQANAAAGNAIAAGTGAYVGTGDSIALGTGAGVGTEGIPGGDRTDHIAIGTAAGQNVAGNQSTAIGYRAGQGVVGDGNIALGVEAGRGLAGNNNISIGVNANDGAGARAQAIAIGDGTAAGSDSVALGSGATAAGSETVALGKDSIAGANGVALGAHAEAQGSNIALGRNSAARESDVAGVGYLTGEAAPGSAVSVGNSNPGEAFQRRITNVSDGAQRYDAVNVGQLQGAQQSVANLVGGNVTVEPNGSFGGYVIELEDQDGVSHQYTTVAEAINAVSSGAISVLPGNAVIYNPNGTVTVAQGVVGTDAVNVEQLNDAVAESGVKYYSANTTIDANRGNDGATADNAMAIGPAAVASGTSSLAVGHAARVNAGAHNGVAIGHDVSARAENATVLGNRSHSYDAGGVAIGQQAVSRGQNSIVMGTGAEADPKSGQTVDNAIVIGTAAEATADDGIAVGQSALASEDRAVAQGFDAHAMAVDSQAFGTRARTTGVNSQASGTDAHASGANAIATGTNSRGYAIDGIAMGTGAISGFVVDIPGDVVRNHGSIAIGDTSRADNLNAMALGVEAQARAESATAIGDAAVATQDAEDGLAVGSSARVTAQNASAFGRGAEAVAEDALAAGSGARASGQSASAVGHGAEASAANASAFGQGARALHQGSVALGSGAETAAAVGTSSHTVDKNTYSFAGTAPVATVSVGTAGQERTITNVAAGRVSATSTDAINGSQLHGTILAVDALGNDLDTAGGSVAAALGGTSVYNPVTHTVTAGLSVQGNNYTNVQEALTYVGQGWNVSAQGGATANVAPGGTVDFNSPDGNVVVGRDGTNLTFGLADNLIVGNSITIGDTVMNGDRITTNNLTVEGETRLGDNFVVNNAGDVTYNGSEIANQADGLSFAGNTGGIIDKTLGDTTPLTISGGLAAGEATTGANLRVDSDGNQLNLVMARNLTDLDSITINNGGPVISSGGINMNDTQIVGLADGTADDHAVNLGQLKGVEQIASRGWDISADGDTPTNVAPGATVDFGNTDNNIEVSRTADGLSFDLAENIDLGEDGSVTTGDTVMNNDGVQVGGHVSPNDPSTTIGAGVITVAGSGATPNTIVISGEKGDITGLTNINLDDDDFAQAGRAATEEQLDIVNQTANAGWNVAANAEADPGDGSNNVAPGATVDFSNDDSNIEIERTGTDLVFNLAENIDLGEDGSVTTGDTVMNNDGVQVGGHVSSNDPSTTIGAGVITVAGSGATPNIIVINGEEGDITGLTNINLDDDDFAKSGRAATEEQLSIVNDTANMGWNVSANGEPDPADGSNNVAPGATVDFSNDDGNIEIDRTGTDLAFNLAENIDLGVDGSLQTGATLVNNEGVKVGDTVSLTDTGLAIDDGEGNSTVTTIAGTTVRDAAGNVNTMAADGTTVTNSAGDITTVGAGTISVTDAGGATEITGTQVVVGGGNPVTIDGDKGTIGGLTNKTWNKDGPIVSGQAATEDQLMVVSEAANAGWNLAATEGEQVNIGPNGLVTFEGDQNIGVAQTGVDQNGVIQITLDRDLDVDSVTAGDSVLDTDGLVVTDDDENTTTVAANGTTVTDADDNRTFVGAGTVEVTDATGTTAIGGDTISVGGANPIMISGNTGMISGLQNQSVFHGGFADGSGRAATEEQLGSITNFLSFEEGADGKPVFNYNGQDHTSLTAALDSMHWNVEAPAPDNSEGGSGGGGGAGGGEGSGGSGGSGGGEGSGGGGSTTPIHNTNTLGFVQGDNIVISKTDRPGGSGADIKMSLAQDVTVNSITAIQIDAQNVTADQIAINNGGPVISSQGIDMSGNRITNMAPGVETGDAVNVGQLQAATDNLQGQVHDLRGDLRRQDRKLSAGVAAAMATAALPQAYLPGKTMMSMAAGTWNGESGMAMGFSGITDNGHWVYKLSGNATSRGDYGGAVGIGYQW